ncbi:MAG: hypothetical protein ABSG22_04355 [Sedimentisphaerales bacterium]|jgi:hypothetical protein
MKIAFGWGAKGEEGYERMTGEGSQFVIFNQPESVRAGRTININHFLKGKENEN